MENNNTSERLFNSLEGLQKAPAPDFFYTRLIGRMQNELPEKKAFFVFRPLLITISLSVVLLLNIMVLTKNTSQSGIKKVMEQNEGTGLQSFANAYNLNTESVYE